MRELLVVLVAMVASGCWLSIPSCKDGEREATYPLDDGEVVDARAFRFEGRLYEECTRFCAERTGEQVISCEGPLRDGGAPAVTCRVRGRVCKLPEVVDP